MYSASDNEEAFLYRLQIISPLESVLCRIVTLMGNLISSSSYSRQVGTHLAVSMTVTDRQTITTEGSILFSSFIVCL
jgi:hypothetical protein